MAREEREAGPVLIDKVIASAESLFGSTKAPGRFEAALLSRKQLAELRSRIEEVPIDKLEIVRKLMDHCMEIERSSLHTAVETARIQSTRIGTEAFDPLNPDQISDLEENLGEIAASDWEMVSAVIGESRRLTGERAAEKQTKLEECGRLLDKLRAEMTAGAGEGDQTRVMHITPDDKERLQQLVHELGIELNPDEKEYLETRTARTQDPVRILNLADAPTAFREAADRTIERKSRWSWLDPRNWGKEK